jgi:hypothetical protein
MIIQHLSSREKEFLYFFFHYVCMSLLKRKLNFIELPPAALLLLVHSSVGVYLRKQFILSPAFLTRN